MTESAPVEDRTYRADERWRRWGKSHAVPVVATILISIGVEVVSSRIINGEGTFSFVDIVGFVLSSIFFFIAGYQLFVIQNDIDDAVEPLPNDSRERVYNRIARKKLIFPLITSAFSAFYAISLLLLMRYYSHG